MPSSLLSLCLCLLALLGVPASRAADARPVSVQDLCLMLRSGYTGGEVLQETAGRPLLSALTPDDEKILRAAGADQRLVDAMKVRAIVSPAEAVAARQPPTGQDQRPVSAARQMQPGSAPQPTPPPRAVGDAHAIANMLHGKLVVFRDEKLVEASGDALEGKKLIGLYFTMLLSKAGAAFTNDLVQFYRNDASKHPEFEVVLVSSDTSPYSMENLMRHGQMPWPAVAFDQVRQMPMLTRFMDRSGASRLLVIDNFGRIHADYHISTDNPQVPMILPDLEKVLADPAKNSVLAPPVVPK